MNLVDISKSGLSAPILAATVLPVTITSIWPDKNADCVAALSPKRIISVPSGALSVNSRSSNVPAVRPTLNPERSDIEPMVKLSAAKAP